MITTAVVILNWNGEHLLEEFLPSVVKYSDIPDTKVYVVDNGSTDGSVDFVKRTFTGVELIELDKNYGFTGGYNRALNIIDAEYFVVLNSDVAVTENWLPPIIDKMKSDSTIAVAMPKIKDYKDKDKFEYAGAAGGYIDRYGYPFCRGRIFDTVEQDRGQYDTVAEVFWATGACLFIRSDIYRKFGGLDEDFFAHMEEIDLCWRVKNRGYRAICVPQSTVYHLGGGTLSELNPKKVFLNHRNNLLMLLKNLPSGKLFGILFIRMILDGVAAMSYLAKGKLKFFVAVIKAHFSFYGMFGKYYKKRDRDANHISLGKTGIINQYFIKGNRTFDKLKGTL
ncbi:MAG: glycosyltransferase family 2 protein [Bacteroidales bacterium]|jgi:GT2 family glycosyltransferase|nr:glycosyltransferase family 2 protein [Bacteroidales bacterium]